MVNTLAVTRLVRIDTPHGLVVPGPITGMCLRDSAGFDQLIPDGGGSVPGEDCVQDAPRQVTLVERVQKEVRWNGSDLPKNPPRQCRVEGAVVHGHRSPVD